MYEKNPKAVRYSLGTYYFLRNRVDSANGFSVSLLGIANHHTNRKLCSHHQSKSQHR